MTRPEENHASIRLRVDQPGSEAQVAVDEQGKITVAGILHKHATMVDISDGQVISSDFILGPPPDGVAAWAASWTTSLRPPHLGPNQVCARAERDPHRSARILRSFTVVDLIPPSPVPDLAVSNITTTSAKVTWGAATDNYGLAGYEVTVDGGPAHQTTVATRSFTITGLTPSTNHTVSVVAIDLAGNTSTPATTSFTTAAETPPPNGDLTIEPHQGAAIAVWHPDAADATYRAFLDGELFDEFSLDQYCQNAANPCTAQDVISYPIEPLEEDTPYTFRVDAVRAAGTPGRSLSGSFTTTVSTPTVPTALTQQVASDSSRCAGMGGDFYLSPTTRAAVPIPTGSTQIFDGCYNAANSSCLDTVLPPSGDKLLNCTDDLTRLLVEVAPDNRGPVIASLDDVAPAVGALAPGDVLIEPITWCIHDETCTIILETAPEALALLSEAEAISVAVPALAVGISWLVVIGGGIALGLVLFSLYEILFPEHIGFNGILEYPIDFDTNFDTFEQWFDDGGDWVNSLKIFAEVTKTTNQAASRHNIPFAWNRFESGDLKSIIDSACSVQKGTFPATSGCGDGFAVYVPGAKNYRFEPMPQTGTHIVTAMGNGRFPQPPQRNQWYNPARSEGGKAAKAAGFSRRWYFTSAFATNNPCIPRQPGTTCDEFPFWATNQAVTLSGIRADLEPVAGTETVPQRDDIIGFYNKCKVKDTNRFLVLPVKSWVAAGGPSFGFRVDQGGTSLCMEPTPGGP